MPKVKTNKRKLFPMEFSREKITDDKFVNVPDTHYYRRAIRDGSLIQEVSSAR